MGISHVEDDDEDGNDDDGVDDDGVGVDNDDYKLMIKKSKLSATSVSIHNWAFPMLMMMRMGMNSMSIN